MRRLLNWRYQSDGGFTDLAAFCRNGPIGFSVGSSETQSPVKAESITFHFFIFFFEMASGGGQYLRMLFRTELGGANL